MCCSNYVGNPEDSARIFAEIRKDLDLAFSLIALPLESLLDAGPVGLHDLLQRLDDELKQERGYRCLFFDAARGCLIYPVRPAKCALYACNLLIE